MDLNTLASNLRAQAAANSTIVLDAAVFADDTVRAGIRSAFALPAGADLMIKGVQAAAISDAATSGVLTISGGKTAVLKKKDIRVSLTFTAPGGKLQLIVLAEMGPSWKFEESFKDLDTFPFKFLETSGAHFVYTTSEQPEYVWPGDSDKIRLEPGLNFLSHVTFKHFSTIKSLLDKVIKDWSLSFKFYGPFGPKEGQSLPVGKLRAPLVKGTFGVGIEPNALTLSDPTIAVRIGAGTDDEPWQKIELVVEADLQKRVQVQQGLQVVVGIPMHGDGFEISTVPLPNSDSIDQIIQSLPGGTAFRQYLPKELTDVFANVGLDNFSLFVSTEPKVTYLGLSISTIQPWEVIRSVLTLEKLSLEIQTIEPTGLNWTRVHIAARSKFLPKVFDNGYFAFNVDLEKQAAWELKSISGAYFGGVSLGNIVRGLLDSDQSVPSVLNGIVFSDFGVNVHRENKESPFTYSFSGSVEASFPILDTTLASILHVAVTKTGTNHTIKLSGGLSIGDELFALSLNLGEANSKLTARWQRQGAPLGFGDIASAFGWKDMPAVPEGLDLKLKEAQFTYDFQKKSVALTAKSANYGNIVFASLITAKDSPNPEQRVYVFSIDIPLNLKFTELPVVGESLHLDTPVGIDNLQIIIASSALGEKDVKALNALLKTPENETPLMPTTLIEGVTLAAKLEMAGPHEVVLPLSAPAKKLQAKSLPPGAADDGAPAETPPTGLTAPAETPPTGGTAPAYQADAKWFELKKTLGPVYFDKIGVQYQGKTLRFLLNAAMSAAGLTLSVEGLSVGSPLTKVELDFDLRGLGIDYKAGDIEIGGAFLRTVKKGQPDSYDGAAVIKTKQFALSALGSYTKLKGQPSLFIYAFLDYPLGGPSFFFVTGLAAGFGYNRRLIAPSIDKVSEFPLVTQAMKGRSAAPAGVMDALEKLQTYVPPNLGSIFLAVGVKFNSFKLIDSFALLTVEFGNNFSINLLGVSTAIVPTPEAGKAVTPLAQVQIAWKATFDPDDGCLGIDARLTPNSYILSKDCRLSGGFAFYSWFSGPHAGDFVQTLGGYHPAFDVPKHYPKVPRLAFDWKVSNSLTIQGDAYYALTGSALMAGGHLEVLYKEGDLRAWLKVGADFLIAWKPYHYDARLYVNVGASYTFDIDLLLGHVRCTISVDVGAQLHLWGPDFSGTASIDLSVISFTIAFGAGASQAPPPLQEWSTFQQSFLPAKDVCSISVKDGLVRKIETAGKERWVINPKQLSLVVDSAIPFKSAPPGVSGEKDIAKGANVEFGVGPMAVSSAKFYSTLTVTLKKGGQTVNSEFKYLLIKKRVPAGLWGQTATPKLNGDSFIESVPSGIEIIPGKLLTPRDTATINLNVFEYTNAFYPDGKKEAHGHAYEWQPAGAFKPTVREPQARRKAIRDGVGNNSLRASMLKELNVDVKVNVRSSIADDFVDAPQVGTL
jgi:hypothetical protein